MTALVFDEVVVRDGDRAVLEVQGRMEPGSVLVVRGAEASVVSAVLDLLVRGLDGRSASPGPLRMTGSIRTEPTAAGPVRVAVAPREHGLIGGLSAVENVLLGVLAHRPATADDARAAADLLDALGVPAAVHANLAEQLSGGQQQRVAVARALATEAPVVALDDPVSELDDRTRGRVLGLLGRVRPDAVLLVALPDDGDHRHGAVAERDDAWSAGAVVLRVGERRRASGRHART